jgi:hypothetical protein
MRSRAVVTIVEFINQGDLYAEGVRLYLLLPSDPVPNGVPDTAWAGRQVITCADWSGVKECLFRVP